MPEQRDPQSDDVAGPHRGDPATGAGHTAASREPDHATPASRRTFIGASCGAGIALAISAGRRPVMAGPREAFAAVDLVDARGQRLRCSQLEAGREYIFHYPFRSTPCFLIDLGRPVPGGASLRQADGSAYVWKGGTGEHGSVVAFSAICAHKLSHPSPEVSFIGYRDKPIGFFNQRTQAIERRAGLIQCCSEQSVYDPAHGAQVMAGPAAQPLAAIELREHDGCLRAVGVYGGALFERYFEAFADRLMLQFKGDGWREPVVGQARVQSAEQFSRTRIACG